MSPRGGSLSARHGRYHRRYPGSRRWSSSGAVATTSPARALVMGILNRTPDSFFDKGATWDWDAFWARADQIVNEGADILDVGAVKAGPGRR